MKVTKISPEVVVKIGSHVTVSEAKNMMFVDKYTKDVPGLEVSACYSYGSARRDIDDHGSETLW